MYLHFGQRPFGKCDVVPELFYVATWFFHTNFVPLVPLGTRLILGQSGKTYQTLRIPFSLKSLLYAWFRTALLAGMAAFGIMALMALSDPQQHDWDFQTPALFAAFCGILFALVMIYPRRKKPSYSRACQLAHLANLDDRGWAALNVLYGRDPFEKPADAALAQF